MELHTLTYPDTQSKEYYKARYHYLLQIIFGETMAIDYCKKMSEFAPSKETCTYLLKQQEEEDLHLDMLTEYVGANPRPEVLLSPYVKKIHLLMAQAIEERDYSACILIQNFIAEGLNITFLRELEHHADGKLSELCTKILHDEVGHMEFGIIEMKRIISENKDSSSLKKLTKLHRKTLMYIIGLASSLVREAKDLGIPLNELAGKAISEHFWRIKESKFPVSIFDIIIFKSAILFFKLF